MSYDMGYFIKVSLEFVELLFSKYIYPVLHLQIDYCDYQLFSPNRLIYLIH